MTQKQWI